MKSNIPYIVVPELKTIARINNETKVIEVSNKFDGLSEINKDFILIQLGFFSETWDICDADKKAINEIIKLYSEEGFLTICTSVFELFKLFYPETDMNMSRLINIKEEFKSKLIS